MLKTLPHRATNEKCCSVEGGRWIYPLFSSPPWGSHSSRLPTPGNLPSKAKKNVNARGGAGRSWNWLMHNVHFLCENHLYYLSKQTNGEPCHFVIFFFNRKLSIWPTTTNELHAAVRLAPNLLAAPPPIKELQRPLILPATQATKIRNKKTSRTIEAGQENTKEPPCRSYISYNSVLVYVLW